MDKKKLIALITAKGSENSHMAILARSMNIPAIINTGSIDEKYEGANAIVDGFSGNIYIDPDKKTIQDILKRKNQIEHDILINTIEPKSNYGDSDIHVYANINELSDIDEALKNGAEGIGLFRTEFIYLKSKNYPTEETQFKIYKEAALKADGKKVVIRTIDIGADKNIKYFDLDQEPNPAMGLRAIRICLKRRELFKTQLKAILRASVFGNIALSFPLIVSIDEIKIIRHIVEEVKSELRKEFVSFNDKIQIGIMIETPAAAIISDKLAECVDFFSIGTNDLTQFTLASDRQNEELSRYFNPIHPAVLRLVRFSAENAYKNGIPISVCGELGKDFCNAESIIKLGINNFSVSPTFILPLREKLRNLDIVKV